MAVRHFFVTTIHCVTLIVAVRGPPVAQAARARLAHWPHAHALPGVRAQTSPAPEQGLLAIGRLGVSPLTGASREGY